MPVYNRASIIIKTLESIINQTYKDLEIIIIDDCSDDFSKLKSIVESYNDNRIILTRNLENMNGAFSRNVGIEKATGKYIAFMDSDDTWELDKIEKQVKLAETLTGSFLIYCKSNVIRRGFSELLPTKAILETETIADYLFVNNGYMPTPSLFLPTYIAKNNLFNKTLRRHQDYDFLLKLEKENIKFIFLDEVLVNVYANHIEKSEKRGANYTVSKKFLEEYLEFFNEKNANYFWLKNIGFYMSRSSNKMKALQTLLLEKRYAHVKKKDLIVYVIYYLTINTFLYSFLEKIYKKFN